MTVRPGYGIEALHLGATTTDLQARFGEPAVRRRSGSFREYWIYPSDHFDCIVSRRSRRVLSIFFHAGNRLMEPGIFHQNETAVRTEYSAPALEGGGFTSMTGNFINRWYSYDNGLGFDFDQKGRLQTVSVFAAKQTAKSKATASIRHSHEHSLAALRVG
jgi:hypothetical protein